MSEKSENPVFSLENIPNLLRNNKFQVVINDDTDLMLRVTAISCVYKGRGVATPAYWYIDIDMVEFEDMKLLRFLDSDPKNVTINVKYLSADTLDVLAELSYRLCDLIGASHCLAYELNSAEPSSNENVPEQDIHTKIPAVRYHLEFKTSNAPVLVKAVK